MIDLYLRLWLYWLFWLFLYSLVAAVLVDMVLVGSIYLIKGAPSLDEQVRRALGSMVLTIFGPLWSMVLIGTQLIVLRRMMQRCFGGKRMILLTCKGDERIWPVGLGDVLSVWRRWVVLIAWMVMIETVLVIGGRSLLGMSVIGGGLDIPTVGIMIVLAVSLSLPLMMIRCRRIRVSKC